ncbi:MAG: acyl-CoA dehydratase activase-related protein [Acidobacteria bacterium]|nr:acyl-CoA dehydratase activase-related protein [Acidobacteriota bacterium]
MATRPLLTLGIDVGSTAIKTVVERGGEIVWHDYRRHESRAAEQLLDVLREVEATTGAAPGQCHAFITGSGGAALAEIVGARFVQEVAALSVAVERRHPDAGAVGERGGHDAKVLLFEEDSGRRRTIVSMNDKCAGGTGAVIDKLAAKLQIPPDAVGALRYTGLQLYPVAGKCGVFAETDMNGLQKRGVPPDELMASLFDAIVVQNLAVLSRGHTLRPRVLLVGGPHAFIRGLREAWQAHLAQLWTERGVVLPDGLEAASLIEAPAFAAHLVALGAIEFGRRAAEAVAYRGAAALAEAPVEATVEARRATGRRGVPAIGVSGSDLHAFRAQYERPPWTPPVLLSGTTVVGFMGLDAGSTSTKAVLLDEAGEVVAKAYQLSRGNPIEDAIDMFRALRQQVESQGASIEVRGLVTTGYAKDMLHEVFAADAALVETVAHAESALQLYEDPHVIVDVGGQDIKIIALRNGRVKDFRLHTQCSAGNGYFLQAIAQNLGMPVERFAEEAFSAREMPQFSYGCVLFLQTEIASVQSQGWSPAEILAGLAHVLPKNVFLYVAKTPNLARFGTRFVLQGGTQRNLAVVKAEVDFIRENFRGQDHEPEIVLHPHAGEAGAIGAALEAIRLWRSRHATTFIGLDAAERIKYRTTCNDETRCHFCTNDCLRTFIEVWNERPDGQPDPRTIRRLIVANCEKGNTDDLDRMREIKAGLDAVKARTPNMVTVAGRDVWKPTGAPLVTGAAGRRAWRPRARRDRLAARVRLRVGIPRVFNMYAHAPLFSGYLESLGVPASHIVYSDQTTTELYKAGTSRGSIDPCFPSKIALAPVHNLLQVKHPKTPLDCVFFPMIDAVPSRLVGVVGNNACPTVALTPQTVRAAFTKAADLFAALGRRYFRRQMYDAWAPLLHVSRQESDDAVEAGFAALARYEETIRRKAREALDALEREGRLGIVILGRPYHHDPGLNHGIAEELQKLGYAVFSQNTLPLDEDLLERLFGDEVRAGIIHHPLDISDVWKNSFSASSNAKVWAAKFTARHPNLVAVELSNFKCGHDAPIFSVIAGIIERSGTPYFAFKDLDENRPAGSIKLRLETIDYSLKRYQERLARRARMETRIDRWTAGYARRVRERIAAEPDSAAL